MTTLALCESASDGGRLQRDVGGVMGSDRLGPKLGVNEQEARIEDLTEEAPVGLVEVTGFIKWFDVSKGYGFIVPDNGMPDVLLHVTCLRRDGFQGRTRRCRGV
jgi:hypothetical protein